ncbi:MAG: PepSY domain-containing protein [Candidatus Contendobacter sp.]|nr:PepSY domain-containing protein [Candidatus Contendobacter sp.]
MNLRHLLNAAAFATFTTVATMTAFAAGEAPAPVPAAAAAPAKTTITKEQAIEMALKAHPGKVTKAYEETKKGKKTWEVKIKGDDGRTGRRGSRLIVGEALPPRWPHRREETPPRKMTLMTTDRNATEITVWDPLIRLFHWTLVIALSACSTGPW